MSASRFNERGSIRLDELKIPSIYLANRPKGSKIKAKEAEYLSSKKFKAITIDSDNNLTNGFITVLLARKYGVKEVPYVVKGETVHGMNIYYSVFFSAYYEDRALCKKLIKEAVKDSDDIANRREYLYHMQDGICYICGRKTVLIYGDGIVRDNMATIDHKIPLALSGTNDMSNLAICCHRCNFLKGSLMYSDKLKEIITEQRQYEEDLGLR